MNIGALIVLFKLLQDAGVAVSPIGPPAPPPTEYTEVKPICAPGHYAYKEPLSGLWSCLVIPKGR